MITFINARNESIVIGKDPLRLLDFDKGKVNALVQATKSVGQDGAFFNKCSLDVRDLQIEMAIVAESSEQKRQLERKLNKIFNPKLGEGQLIFEKGNEKRKIIVSLDSSPVFLTGKENNVRRFQRISIPLTAYNPYWLSANELKTEIAIWKGAFGFELEIPNDTGIEVGYREPSLIVNCINEGDTECGMRLVFRANGTVVNPSLFNVNTREYVKINTTMLAGDEITVTTYYGKKRIELYRNGVKSNILHFIDLNSTFLQLDVGDNLFRYDAAENIDGLEIDIYYMPQYLGA